MVSRYDNQPSKVTLQPSAGTPPQASLVIASADFTTEATLTLAEFTRFVAGAQQLLTTLRWDHAQWLYASTMAPGRTPLRHHLIPRGTAQEIKVGSHWVSRTAPLCGKAYMAQHQGWLLKPVVGPISTDNLCATCYKVYQSLYAEATE